MDAHKSNPTRENFLYGSKRYRNASRRARNRSGNICQLCGLHKATTAHHWAPEHEAPSCREVQHTDLTALCDSCHQLAHIIRALLGAGVPPAELPRRLRKGQSE